MIELFPLSLRDISTFGVGGLFLMIAAQGGLGGGGIMVPIFVILNEMEIKQAIPIANAMVLGGGIANYLVFRKRQHPERKHSPMVDWNIIIMLEPSTMIGAIIGVYVNKMLPDLLVVALLVLTLSFSLSKMILKAKNVYKKEVEEEKILREKAATMKKRCIQTYTSPNDNVELSSSSDPNVKKQRNANNTDVDVDSETDTDTNIDINYDSVTGKNKNKKKKKEKEKNQKVVLNLDQFSIHLGNDINENEKVKLCNKGTTNRDSVAVTEGTSLLHRVNSFTPPVSPPNTLIHVYSDVDIYYNPSSGVMPMEEESPSLSSFKNNSDDEQENLSQCESLHQIKLVEEENDLETQSGRINGVQTGGTDSAVVGSPVGSAASGSSRISNKMRNSKCPPKITIQNITESQSVLEYNKIITHESKVSTWKVVSLSVCFLGICVLNILQGGSSSSLLGTKCGSPMYYFFMMLLLLWVLGFFLYFRYHVIKESRWKAANRHYNFDTSEIRWDKMINNSLIPLLSLLAGLTAGLFGIGGGIVKGPLLMELGVVPQAAAAAAATMILFTAAAACITNLVLGTIEIGYGIAWLIWGFLMTYIGQMIPVWIDKWRFSKGHTSVQTKQYPVLFSVVAITSICILLMVFERIFNYIKTGVIDTQFHSLCQLN